MKERPILFNAPMVRAILSGAKTQTRRICKFKDASGADFSTYSHEPMAALVRMCPYGRPGDRFWVRESFRQAYEKTNFSNGIVFRADALKACGMEEYSDWYKWKPSIHMPRCFSRIALEITEVNVERLQDISESDAIAEGCAASGWTPSYSNPDNATGADSKSAKDEYAELWESINDVGSWRVNPWVWVISFKVIKS